jgi:hypothetical protein
MGAKAAVLVASLIGGLTLATEVFAYLARLAPELGAPLWRQHVLAVYGPWRVLLWAWWWLGLIPWGVATFASGRLCQGRFECGYG